MNLKNVIVRERKGLSSKINKYVTVVVTVGFLSALLTPLQKVTKLGCYVGRCMVTEVLCIAIFALLTKREDKMAGYWFLQQLILEKKLNNP